jgi:hypothetical protein
MRFKAAGQLGFNVVSRPTDAVVVHLGPEGDPQHPLCSAAGCVLERQTLKPVFHFIGYRLWVWKAIGYGLWVNLIQRAEPHRSERFSRGWISITKLSVS